MVRLWDDGETMKDLRLRHFLSRHRFEALGPLRYNERPKREQDKFNFFVNWKVRLWDDGETMKDLRLRHF